MLNWINRGNWTIAAVQLGPSNGLNGFRLDYTVIRARTLMLYGLMFYDEQVNRLELCDLS